MNDTFDLKAYLGSKRLLTENYEPVSEEESINDNYYKELDPKAAIDKATIDFQHANKTGNDGLANKIAGNLKIYLDYKQYDWKKDPKALEILDGFLDENINGNQSSNIIRQLKPGQEYTWFMGASPMKCTYIGKDEKEPTYTFKLGNSIHKLSIKDVKDFIEPLSTYEEYAAESNIDEANKFTLGKHGIKKRLKTAVRQALTEKKKIKKDLDPEDIDIESAFTKEPEVEENPEPQPDEQAAAPVDVNPIDTSNTEQKPGFSKEEQEIQNSLKVAYDHATSIGDQKLATQIGNSLKYFVKMHVVSQDLS